MKKLIRYLDLALFAYVGSMAIILCFTSPYLNWDMLGYIGATYALVDSNTTTVHHLTFQTLQVSLPPDAFQAFLNNAYRRTLFDDPTAFAEQLPFYQVRIGYTWLVHILSLTGFSMITAAHAISAVSVVAALVLLFGMSKSFLAPKLRIAIPLAALTFGFTDIARASTPDGLALLAIVGCSFLYLKNEASVLVRLLPLLGFIRTDLNLFSLLMLIGLVTQAAAPKRQLAVAIAATITIPLGIEAAFNHPGWATILYVTLVQPLPYPLSVPPTVTLEIYSEALAKGLRSLTQENSFLTYAILTVCCTLLLRKLTKGVKAPSSSASQLEAICASYIALHFLLLPVAWDRFFVGPYTMGIFALLTMLTERKRSLTRRMQNTQT